MRKIIIPLVAGAALALPTSALAWGGRHQHGDHGRRNGVLASVAAHVTFHNGNDNNQGNENNKGGRMHGGFPVSGTKLSGTGTSFGTTSASVTGTGFTATLSTTWSSATTKTFGTGSFTCAPATASITIGTNAADTFTGKTCSWTKNGTTLYAFLGMDANHSRAFLKEDGTTVTGAVLAAREPGLHLGVFMNAGMNGHCDH